jgi:hypothetical protein
MDPTLEILLWALGGAGAGYLIAQLAWLLIEHRRDIRERRENSTDN